MYYELNNQITTEYGKGCRKITYTQLKKEMEILKWKI